MKTLMLLRHAKSSWKEEGIADHDRPLNKRGKKTAPVIGHLILEKQLVPYLYLWLRFAAIGLWVSFLVPRIVAVIRERRQTPA